MRKILALLLAGTASMSYAESDLISLYNQAVESYPSLIINTNDEKIAQSQAKQGLALLMPNVEGSVSYGASSSAGDNDADVRFDKGVMKYKVELTQAIFNLYAIKLYDAFKENVTATKYETLSTQQTMMVSVAENYFSVLTAKDTVESVQSQLEAVKRQLEQTEQQYEVGLAAITDVLDAQASYDATQVSLIEAEATYDTALQNFAVLTGQIPDKLKVLPKEVTLPAVESGSVSEWVSVALKTHPDVRSVTQTAKYVEKSYGANKANRLPTLAGSVSYTYSDYMKENALLGTEDNGVTEVGISLTVPIYTGGKTSAEILEAGLNYNSALQNLELTKRNVELEVRQAHRQLTADIANVAAQKKAVESSSKALDATQVGYEVGTRNIVEVLSAQSTLFSSKLSFQTAQYDYLLDILKLKQAAGVITEDDLVSLNNMLISE
ncbi:TolC family outer membrane protein [Gynuella sunshinyii]|uniref:Outer membrane protein n=1 Tax=Gynuella sunshinyii YC6258 TaxID=1445510 RepID=A0A0C5V316_9GAMM|nr:TolC family outer membrane protein [Gynuella sunshinyii]AJQ93920.1 outer membrane protein [Gynuella sunshinyii YC6258]